MLTRFWRAYWPHCGLAALVILAIPLQYCPWWRMKHPGCDLKPVRVKVVTVPHDTVVIH